VPQIALDKRAKCAILVVKQKLNAKNREERLWQRKTWKDGIL
jgi:hypothetical protein